MESLSTIIALAVLIVICIFVFLQYKRNLKKGCCGCSSCAVSGSCPSKKEYETRVYIDGMHCSHCSSSVEKAFSEMGYTASVNLEEKYALVHSDSPLDEQEIAKMIEELGFTFLKLE